MLLFYDGPRIFIFCTIIAYNINISAQIVEKEIIRKQKLTVVLQLRPLLYSLSHSAAITIYVCDICILLLLLLSLCDLIVINLID